MNAPRVAPVAALIFDPGDVLYDATLWRRWFLQLLGRLGLHTHYRIFYRVFEREYLTEVHSGRRDFWDALAAYLAEIGLTRGQIDEVLVGAQARQRQLQGSLRPLPGVAATLAQLAAREIRLACLGNSPWPASELQSELAHLGLSVSFEVVLSSRDLGHALPDCEAYRAALAELRLPPDDVAFVGHDALELAGAATNGLWTIGVNHDAEAEADILLERFDQLLSVVTYRCAHVLAG